MIDFDNDKDFYDGYSKARHDDITAIMDKMSYACLVEEIKKLKEYLEYRKQKNKKDAKNEIK